ncbi:hypothetical protein ABPG72_020551 [Tetrahymena utriculariae]
MSCFRKGFHKILTLRDYARASLAESNQKLSYAINEIKKIGVENNELTTKNMLLPYKQFIINFPYFKKQFLQDTKLRTTQYLSQKSQNQLEKQLTSLLVMVLINYPTLNMYQPKQIKELKDHLILKAIEDTVNRAKLSLQLLNYEIKSIKRAYINKTKPIILYDDYFQNHLLLVDTEDLDNKNQLQVNLKKFSVSFVIGEKKQCQN